MGKLSANETIAGRPVTMSLWHCGVWEPFGKARSERQWSHCRAGTIQYARAVTLHNSTARHSVTVKANSFSR